MTGQPARSYPQGAFGSEFLGLLGEVSQKELGTPRYKNAQPGEIVGQTGIEAVYDSILNPGFIPARLRVDSLGRIAGPLEIPKGKQLPTLRLTIDAHLQRAAEKAVKDGMALAVQNGQAPDGRLRGGDGPVHRRDLRARERPQLQPGAGRELALVPGLALQPEATSSGRP